ncbi:MAG: hypothetical protein ACYTGC_13610, partial [Planctomycetota bacterium]
MSCRSTRMRGISAVAMAAGVLGLPPATVRADQTTWYDSPLMHGFNVTHVPDLDQRRAALANNGACYCVPTASIDWMAYLANHGWTEIGPGPQVWTDPTTYGVATFAIDLLGSVMATDPMHGTGGDGTIYGLKFWLRDLPFIVEGIWPTTTWSPTFETAMARGLDGAVVMIAVGWYDEQPDGTLERDGGHMVSVAFAERAGTNRFIGLRDPWTNDSLHAQAPFSTDLYTVTNSTETPAYGSARTMSRIVGYDTARIDWVVSIEPIFLLAYLPGPQVLIAHYADPPDGWLLPRIREYPLPVETSVKSMVRRADGQLLYLTEANDGPGHVFRLNMRTQGVDELDLPLAWPTAMVQGRLGPVYFADGDEIAMFDLDMTGGPEELVRIEPGVPVGAMDYDDVDDRLVVLSPEARELLFFPGHLDAAPEIWDVPGEVPLEAGLTAFCWNDTDGSAWIATHDGPHLWRIAMIAGVGIVAEPLLHPEVETPPTAISSANYYGRMYITAAGRVHELVPNVMNGDWEAPVTPFIGDAIVGEGPVVVPNSRSIWDGSWQVGPLWDDAAPTETTPIAREYDCPADV